MKNLYRSTKVIANGKQGESDVHFGWLAKAVVAAFLSLGVLGVERLFVISAKIEVLDERTTVTSIALTALQNEMKVRVDKAALEYSSCITKENHQEAHASSHLRYRSN